MTFLRSQFSFWIANILLHGICLLQSVRVFTGICSYIYSQKRWQLNSKYITYLFPIYAQHANLPQVPFLTYALSLCFPSTLPSIFNGLAMASREKKKKPKIHEKQEPKKPCSSGTSGQTCLWLCPPSVASADTEDDSKGIIPSLGIKGCSQHIQRHHNYYRSSKPRENQLEPKALGAVNKAKTWECLADEGKEEPLEPGGVTKAWPLLLSCPSKNPNLKQHNQE